MTNETPEASGICRYCVSDLKPKAIYCLNCKQFQGRIRAVISTITVPILVSVATAGVGAYAYLKRTVILPRPVISATALSCSEEAVTIGLANTGTRPAILTGGEVQLTVGKPQHRRLWSEQVPLVLAPDSSKVIALRLYSDTETADPLPMPARSTGCAYDLMLKVKDFDDQVRDPKPLTCRCG